MPRYHYRARWNSAYVSTLHCEILSSCEQIPNWHFQHYRLFTLLYGSIIILWGCTIKLSYLSCLRLCFEAPILKMKMGSSDFVLVGEYWVVFKAIRYGYRARWTSAYVNTLHCEILSSCEQTPNWHRQHDRGLTKGDCRSNMRHLI